MLNNHYNPNNVNADNFNETMQGYIDYMLDYIIESNKNFTDVQISAIKGGFRRGKDEMTLQGARAYKIKF